MRRLDLVVVTLAAVGCNALSGAGDLEIGCPECTESPAPDSGPLTPADASVADAPIDTWVPACTSGAPATCRGNTRVTCENGVELSTPCAAITPICLAGACVAFPSCRGGGLGATVDCGPASGNRDCCASLDVPGGTFNRKSDANFPATVSSFKLDRYEVTVGRFRKFVDAGKGTQASPPDVGSGAHPNIPGTGWRSIWNALLPADSAALRAQMASGGSFATWSDVAGAKEHHPINHVSLLIAYAFCAWDGARLPTQTELWYAAAGGSEQRLYPWGGTAPDATYSVYDCAASPPSYNSLDGTGCAPADIVPVGSRSPKGDGRFGHADLAGSIAEVVIDKRDGNLPVPCVDCARLFGILDGGKNIIILGGSYRDNTSDLRTTNEKSAGKPEDPNVEIGLRCAR